MGEKTSIGWTDHTWNCGVWGCAKVPGDLACTNCYAESYAKMRGFKIWGQDAPRRFLSEDYWKIPAKLNAAALETFGRRARVFCSSMADLYEDREDYVELRERHYEIMKATPNLSWQLLTKRPEIAAAFWKTHAMLDNVHMGVTAVTQKWFDHRVPIALSIGAPVTWVSCEPLMEAIDVSRFVEQRYELKDTSGDEVDITKPLPRLAWLVVGGESGNKRREMDLSWLTSIVKQCKTAGVPCFVKQDSHRYPEKQGRIPDDIWKVKEFPA